MNKAIIIQKIYKINDKILSEKDLLQYLILKDGDIINTKDHKETLSHLKEHNEYVNEDENRYKEWTVLLVPNGHHMKFKKSYLKKKDWNVEDVMWINEDSYQDTGSTKIGDFVKVRPASEDKTYLGIFIGHSPLSSMVKYNEETKILFVKKAMWNPTIYIPELKRVIHGCESWWSKIKNKEDFKSITNDNINNTWYIKLAKEKWGFDTLKNDEIEKQIQNEFRIPVEQGYSHPSEKIILEHNYFNIESKYTNVVIAILITFIHHTARFDSIKPIKLAEKVINHKDHEVRDYAIGVIESYPTKKGLEILQHSKIDSIKYIENYKQKVINDIKKSLNNERDHDVH